MFELWNKIYFWLQLEKLLSVIDSFEKKLCVGLPEGDPLEVKAGGQEMSSGPRSWVSSGFELNATYNDNGIHYDCFVEVCCSENSE